MLKGEIVNNCKHFKWFGLKNIFKISLNISLICIFCKIQGKKECEIPIAFENDKKYNGKIK